MASKTTSLRVEAYEKLRSARRFPGESFSQIVLRAHSPERGSTGTEVLDRYRSHGPYFQEEGLARIERLKRDDWPAEDKWRAS